MRKIKTTFIIDPIDVIRRWSISRLEEFSRNCNVRVVIRGLGKIENGVTTWNV